MEEKIVDGYFGFDPYSGEYCIGNFDIDNRLILSAFSSLITRPLTLYGLRAIDRSGKVADIGLVDPRRHAFERLCKQLSSHGAGVADLKRLTSLGTGLVVNSLQNPHSAVYNGFNELAQKFVANLNCKPGQFPETVDVSIFLGSYDRGFGMHRDESDVTSFVLDGRKHIAVRSDDGADRILTVVKGEYVRWRSTHWHGNRNPDYDWSVTANFSVSPDLAAHDVPPGTPVQFIHSETRLRDHLAYLEAVARRRRRGNS